MVTNWATSFSHYKNRGFRWFLVLSYQFVFLLFPVIFQFSKNSLFQKRGAKIGLFKFQCFKLFFWKVSFLGLLKHNKNRGFSKFGVFLLLKEKKIGQKMITEIYKFGFFWSKNGRFVTHICFPKERAWTPIFVVFWGWALFGPRCQKREILKSHPKKEKFDW